MRRWAVVGTVGTVATLLAGAGSGLAAPQAGPSCAGARVRLEPDYAYAVGSVSLSDPEGDDTSASPYRWLVDGEVVDAGRIGEKLHLPLDGDALGLGREAPAIADGIRFGPGRWSGGLELEPGGRLAYRSAQNIALEAGTIEMWVALRADGRDGRYAERNHVLLQYRAPNGDSISIAQAKDSGILYAGGSVGGRWQSAYGSGGNMRAWSAGEWHHLAYAYSRAAAFMRLYLDGRLVADTNEGRYDPPEPNGDRLFIGGDASGNVADYRIDSVVLGAVAADDDEIAARARRAIPPEGNERWLPTADLRPGSALVFESTPSAGSDAAAPCASEPLLYPGVPLFEADPPSTLLPPGTSAFTLAVRSAVPAACEVAVTPDGSPPGVEGAWRPFDDGAGSTTHTTVVAGLDTDPNVVNRVTVRSSAHPDYRMSLRYRVLAEIDPAYPRTGNLWGWGSMAGKSDEDLARIDLWLGAPIPAERIRRLRRLNPDIRVLASINAVENRGLPDDYYLKGVDGRRVEVWPGSYRLNLTKEKVAEHQALLAYGLILENDLQYDGCFFDNVFTTQSWQTRDIYGQPFQVDSDEDGRPDDPAAFDAAWRAGVFHELETFRRLMPHAIASGHAMNIDEPGIDDIFNGLSIGFQTADVLEGRRGFDALWALYQSWLTRPARPEGTMIESSPPDQIAYGYDYSPREHIPPATLDFARTYYPYMRFGLALTLMGDGYFAHEFGDTWHGNDWWYDELDHDLGQPRGAAEAIELGGDGGGNLVENGGFEAGTLAPWRLWVNGDAGCEAAVVRDTSVLAEGGASARIEVTATSRTDWHLDFAQFGRHLERGQAYELSFAARADRDRPLGLAAQKGSPDWRNYGLRRTVDLRPAWRRYRVTFEAVETTDESRLQFLVGAAPGTVWLDDVRLRPAAPIVVRREFDDGLVLLNTSRAAQDVEVPAGYARLRGSQAARFDRIVDDAAPAFTTDGRWSARAHDSGEWQAAGPFYHDWGEGCHELEAASGTGRAEWALAVDAADVYTITAWWPAAPEAPGWSGSARYEVWSGDRLLASTPLDQRSGGDTWHLIGEVGLDPAEHAIVRLVCDGAAPCVADALHVRSRARLNDGRAVEAVRLAPMDGIVLRRLPGSRSYLPLLTRTGADEDDVPPALGAPGREPASASPFQRQPGSRAGAAGL